MAGHTALAGQLGYTQEQIASLDRAGEGAIDDPAVRVALAYAALVTTDAHKVTDEFFATLRQHYSETQILELTCVIGLTCYFNRFTTALRVDLSGSDEPYDAPESAR